MSDEIDICNWCFTLFPAESALFDMLPDREGHGLIVAACSPEHMLALHGDVHETSSQPQAD